MNAEMQEILSDFQAESSEILETLDRHFVKLEAEPTNAELLNEIFRCMHSMKGSAGFLGFSRLLEVAHQSESLLNKLRKGEMSISPFIIDIIFEAVDAVKLLHADIRETGEDSHVDTALILNKLILAMDSAKDLMEVVPAALVEKKSSVEMTRSSEEETLSSGVVATEIARLETEGTVERNAQADPDLFSKTSPVVPESSQAHSEVFSKIQESVSRSGMAVPSWQPKLSGEEKDPTVRVETRCLDDVMNLVGELVLVRNRIIKLGYGQEEQYGTNPIMRELGPAFAQLNLVTSDLQLAMMKARMVPIRKVFSRIPRLVRDLSNKLGKQVHIDFVGENTDVDKSVVDELCDAIVQLVRNSMDHGLETVQERKRIGKCPEGSVRLTAFHEDNSVVIRIEDDGRGLQVDKIAKIALQKGLVSEAELLSMGPRDVMKLILLPRFNTASQVGDLYCRGLGMDVVQTKISRMNGSLELDSEPGSGSQMTIKLPLRVSVIQALLVEVQSATFAVPLASVIEVVKISKMDIKKINGQAVLNLRESIIPLLDLAQTFQIPHENTNDECYVVVVVIGTDRFGIVVDRLLAREEVVIKSLGEFLSDVQGVAGATITSDGKVSLILDMANLVHDMRGTVFSSME